MPIYGLYKEYSREETDTFIKLCPTESATQNDNAFSKYFQKNNLCQKHKQYNLKEIGDRHWHSCVDLNIHAHGVNILNCGDGYNFIQLYSMKSTYPFKCFCLNGEELRDFYFEITGESFYNIANYVGEKQMENYCGIIFASHTDSIVLHKLAQISAALATQYPYLWQIRPKIPLLERELKTYENTYHKKYHDFSNFSNILKDNYLSERFDLQEYIVTTDSGLNDPRLVLCISNDYKCKMDWKLFVREMNTLAIKYCQKEMIVFENGFPKDLTINKYIMLEPKKILEQKCQKG
jgi:hypothetical protein